MHSQQQVPEKGFHSLEFQLLLLGLIYQLLVWFYIQSHVLFLKAVAESAAFLTCTGVCTLEVTLRGADDPPHYVSAGASELGQVSHIPLCPSFHTILNTQVG